MSSTPTASSLDSAGKKRRSWFDSGLPVCFNIAVERHNEDSDENDVIELLLKPFARQPILDFGVVAAGRKKVRQLCVRNPQCFPQEVSVEKFPYKSNFEVDQTQFTVDADGEVILTLTWSPVEVGNVRETVYLRADQACRLQFVIIAAAKRDVKRRNKKLLITDSRGPSGQLVATQEHYCSELVNESKENISPLRSKPSMTVGLQNVVTKNVAEHENVGSNLLIEDMGTPLRRTTFVRGSDSCSPKCVTRTPERRIVDVSGFHSSSSPQAVPDCYATPLRRTTFIKNSPKLKQEYGRDRHLESSSLVRNSDPTGSVEAGVNSYVSSDSVPDNLSYVAARPCMQHFKSEDPLRDVSRSPLILEDRLMHLQSQSEPCKERPESTASSSRCSPSDSEYHTAVTTPYDESLSENEDADIFLDSNICSETITGDMSLCQQQLALKAGGDNIEMESNGMEDLSEKTMSYGQNIDRQQVRVLSEFKEEEFEVLTSEVCFTDIVTSSHIQVKYDGTQTPAGLSTVIYEHDMEDLELVGKDEQFFRSARHNICGDDGQNNVISDCITYDHFVATGCDSYKRLSSTPLSNNEKLCAVGTGNHTGVSVDDSKLPRLVNSGAEVGFHAEQVAYPLASSKAPSLFRIPFENDMSSSFNSQTFTKLCATPSFTGDVCDDADNYNRTYSKSTNNNSVVSLSGSRRASRPLFTGGIASVHSSEDDAAGVVPFDATRMCFVESSAAHTTMHKLNNLPESESSEPVKLSSVWSDSGTAVMDRDVFSYVGGQTRHMISPGQKRQSLIARLHGDGQQHSSQDAAAVIDIGHGKRKQQEAGSSPGRKQRYIATLKPLKESTQKSSGSISTRSTRPRQVAVAQSKLTLVKRHEQKPVKQPLLYAAKNMYYDERWMEKQERSFVKWMNFVLTPPEMYFDARKQKVDVGKLTVSMDKDVVLAPTKEALSLRAYTLLSQMNQLRRSSCQLYQQIAITEVIEKLECQIEIGRLAVRTDRMLHADLGIKQKIVDLLLSYNPLWLRIGLETIYGEVLNVHSNTDIIGLSRFILSRLLACPDIAAEFAHPNVRHLYKPGYQEALAKFTLKKFLLLVLFLDKAKTAHLIGYNPCLFCKDSEYKSSRDILLAFSRNYLRGEGDVTRHLSYFGYTVTHVQTALDEYDYAVSNLAVDLRDGLKLTRLIEVLTGCWTLSSELRVPAISRLQKIHNVSVVFNELARRGVVPDWKGRKLESRDIVDGHRQKTLQLLWTLIFIFKVDMLLNAAELESEILSVKKRLTNHQLATVSVNTDALPEEGRLTSNGRCVSLLLEWCKVVCALYNLKVENFTVSLSDGRALCYLVHHYYSLVLPRHHICDKTCLSCGVNRTSLDDLTAGDSKPYTAADVEDLIANEKHNFKLLYDAVSVIGGVPVMLKTSDMSNTIPDEKTVITYMAYLCARLLSIRNEQHAASVIQFAWRHYRARLHGTRGECTENVSSTAHHDVEVFVAGDEAAAGDFVDSTSTDQQQHDAVSCDTNYILEMQSVRDRNGSSISHDVPSCHIAEVQQFYYEISCQDILLDVDSEPVNDLLSLPSIESDHIDTCLSSDPCDSTTDVIATSVKYVEALPAVSEIGEVDDVSENLDVNSVSSNVNLEAISENLNVNSVSDDVNSDVASLCCVDVHARHDGDTSKQQLHRRSCIFCQDNAALCIQSAYRRHVAQKAYTVQQRGIAALHQLSVSYLYRMRFDIVRGAAITLQAALRRGLCRRRYLLLCSAVCHIQAVYRGQACRRRYQTLRSVVIALQASARGYLGRKKLSALKLRREQAAVRLQAIIRGYCQRQKYSRAVDVAVGLRLLPSEQHLTQPPGKLQQCLINAAQEGMSKTKMIEMTHNVAARIIQCAFSAWRHRRLHAAIVTCQRTLQALPYRIHFMRLRYAAVTIQTRYRATCLAVDARKNFLNHIGAAIVIQSVMRAFLCRSRYLRLRHAVITIQREYRQRKWLEDNSATVIQSAVRMFIQRKRFLKARRAAVQIQAFYRCKEQKARFRMMTTAAVVIQRWYRRQLQLRRCKAATKIQSLMRMFLVRQQYCSLLQKAVIVQRLSQSFLMHQKFLSIRKSAVTIQQYWKHKILVREAKVRRTVMLNAAIAVQAAVRGYLQRRAYVTMRMEHHSAVKVQKIFRGYTARLQYMKQMKAILVLQAGCRAALVQLQLRRQTSAAVVIQRAARTMIAQRQYQKMQKSIATIQSICRGFLIRQQLRHQREAAVMIQKIYRGFAMRRQFLRRYRSVVYLQACVRGILVRRRLEKQHTACTLIQSVVRRHQLRQSYCRQMANIHHIQRICSGYLAEKRFRRQHEAAVSIQKMVRGMIERMRYIQQRNLIIFTQACVRRHIAVKKLFTVRQSCVIIQKWWRSVQLTRSTRQQFLLSVGAAITLQAAVRCHLLRKKFTCRRSACVRIQATLQMWKARKLYQKLRRSVVAVQHRYRAKIAGWTERLQYIQLRNAAVVLQRRFRAHRIGKIQQARYQQLRSATLIIQQRFRAHRLCQLQKMYYRKLHHATLIIQRRVRACIVGRQQRANYVQLRKSAVVLQRAYKARRAGKLQRCRYESLRWAALTVQCRFRARHVAQSQRLYYQNLRHAVLLIQRVRRRQLAVRQQRQRENACVKIQSMIRMHIARSNYRTIRPSCVIIQKWWRSVQLTRSTRQQFLLSIGAAITLQAAVRCHLLRKKFTYRRSACVRIQATLRMWKARKLYQKLRRSVVAVQHRYRAKIAGWTERLQYIQLRHAAVVLQRRFRAHRIGKIQQARYQQLRSATLIIQQRFRAHRLCQLQKMYYRKLHHATLIIQRRVRACIVGRQQRTNYVQLRKSAVVSAVRIQSWYRMVSARKSYGSQRAAVTRLQSAARCLIQQRMTQRRLIATLLIQRWWLNRKLSIQQRTRFVELRQSAVIIQTALRRYLARSRYLTVRKGFSRLAAVVKCRHERQRYLKLCTSVSCIGRWYRSNVAARTFAQMILLRKNHAARVIQSSTRKYLDNLHRDREEKEKLRATETAAALTIQRTFATYLQRKRYLRLLQQVVIVQATVRRWLVCRQMTKLTKIVIYLQSHTRGFLCRRRLKFHQRQQAAKLELLTVLARRHLAAVCIQRKFRRCRLMLRAKQHLTSVRLLQSWLRTQLERRRYLRAVSGVRQLQSLARSWMDRRNAAAVVIQSVVRMWLVRRHLAYMQHSAVIIQALWHGHSLRRRIKNKKVHEVRRKVQEATRNVTEENKLHHRTSIALDFLLNCRDVSHVLQTLNQLEVVTRLSPESCQRMADGKAVDVIFNLMRHCNRSVPHMEILKSAICILINLSKYERTAAAVYDAEGSVETLVELLQIYREKGGNIFTNICMLLGVMGFNDCHRQAIVSRKTIVNRLCSIHALTLRKHELNQKRLASKTKVSASCTSLAAGVQYQQRIRPAWMMLRDTIHAFDDPVIAIRFAISSLQLQP